MVSTDDATSEKGIESPDVVDKYKTAADIVSGAIDLLRRACYAGMKVGTLCTLGDAKIDKSLAAVYTKAKTEAGEKLEKGVAFPTCITLNNCAAHFCPIATDPEADIVLSAGDVVSIQLGAHIDGYASISAQTMVARASKEEKEPAPLTGRQADAAMAAYTAAEALLRVMRPGKSNANVTEVIQKVADDFGVQALDGVLSHEMKRYVIDGSRAIANRSSREGRVEEWEFGANEVYCIDVVMSTGDGRAREMSTKETVYKRQVDVDYKLKLKTSRAVFGEINRRFPTMPFTLRALEDPKKARMAMTEMTRHNLVVGYPVLYEREGETVARCSMTVLVLPSQTMRITRVDVPAMECGKELKDEEVKALLAVSLGKKKKKKAKKRKPAGGAGGSEGGEASGPTAMETE